MPRTPASQEDFRGPYRGHGVRSSSHHDSPQPLLDGVDTAIKRHRPALGKRPVGQSMPVHRPPADACRRRSISNREAGSEGNEELFLPSARKRDTCTRVCHLSTGNSHRGVVLHARKRESIPVCEATAGMDLVGRTESTGHWSYPGPNPQGAGQTRPVCSSNRQMPHAHTPPPV